MRGLYAIIDVGTLAARGIDPIRFASAVLVARPAALQLRAKELPAREILGLLRTLGPMCKRVKVPLVTNDRADLAVFSGCDMVHVGQDDIAVDLVRRIAPGLRLGISTHTLAQLAAALHVRPAYVAYGPVYATTTKSNPSPTVGIAELREANALAMARGVPLVAIGGITLDRASEIAGAADAGAVIAALLPETNDLVEVTARAIALHAALLGTGGAIVVGAGA